MKNKDFDYSKEDIIKCLMDVGVTKGDNIFIHSNIGFFGRLKDAKEPEDFYRIFKEAIFNVIGDEGTMVVPTFSYSFCWNQNFDKKETESVCGIFSEMVRKDPNASRSEDANFSIAAKGGNAEYFTSNSPEHSFGEESFWERFLGKNGKFCNFNFDSASTFIHYVEKCLKVPYRYDKKFSGLYLSGEKPEKRSFYHFVYDLEKPHHGPDFAKFNDKAIEKNLVKSSNLGRGQITIISAKDTFKLIEDEIKINPSFLIKGKIE